VLLVQPLVKLSSVIEKRGENMKLSFTKVFSCYDLREVVVPGMVVYLARGGAPSLDARTRMQ